MEKETLSAIVTVGAAFAGATCAQVFCTALYRSHQVGIRIGGVFAKATFGTSNVGRRC